ncbi:MAG: hypothetical protein COT33_03450 [Candidatus Nealsonbacteria bacterium CG08_land_8_20_14_0_20_38_20]|uniref:Type 4 fimbrial biogenesis protein PilX N-terminal domain-containing protein n=1 Tax=Candidatus Nealsonbacteria bacterium CG08_land_8_20_14_0_20_38_20 TaxID=1974705 RepID=A0A2H0YN01_9BACT|nr:MAG: hypothetical protein COT33_03450 [Candidatus Nealsonbacteria bacterium CG08_land_8_20_14_0_20_38_20]
MKIKNLKLKIKNSDTGFAALYITLLVMAFVFAAAVGIFVLTFGEEKISLNAVESSQAYFASEAGIEDALLRLSKDSQWSKDSNTSYPLEVNGANATVTVTKIIGGSRTITSEGNDRNRIRKIEVAYEVGADKVSFHYGAQVGEGGIIMDNNSTIYGNVFSNDSITAAANTEITGTAIVAKNGNKISGATLENAQVDICQNTNASGTLTAATVINCTYSNFVPLTEEIATTSFPISQNDIDDWKTNAASGGTILNYLLQDKQEAFLGPKKIDGNMTIQNQAKLYITGTIWVTGTITIQDQGLVRLDPASYGSLSGAIIGDGVVTLQDSAKALGSGQAGSYLLIISTNNSNPALTIQNSFEADILFTPNGWIIIQDTADTREITGYGIHLKSNAEIRYEIGLENTSFSSGPGGSWGVSSWRETE